MSPAEHYIFQGSWPCSKAVSAAKWKMRTTCTRKELSKARLTKNSAEIFEIMIPIILLNKYSKSDSTLRST